MLLFIQSIFVYGFMILAMMHAGKYAYEHQYPDGFLGNDIYAKEKTSFLDIITKSHFIIPILVFCLFAALRFNVGVDCESYRDDFYDMLQKGKTDREGYEIGYLLTIKFSLLFTNTSYLFFAILSFLQISFIYYSMRKESYLLIFYGLAMFFSGYFFIMMNGVRQCIAASAFVAMVPLFLNKKDWIYLLPAVFAAMLFHKSAILIIPFGFAAYFLKDKMLNRNVQLVILILCVIFMGKLENSFFKNIFEYGTLFGYDERQIEGYSELEKMNINFGFRSFILLFNYIIVILYSTKMNEFYKSEKFRFIYGIFFIDICLFHLFYTNFTIKRILYYSTVFDAIIISYLLFYLWFNKNKTNNAVFAIIIASLTLPIGFILFQATQLYPLEASLYKFNF